MLRSLFLPRNDTQRPAAKRAKTPAATADEDVSHRANIMDLGDEDETANDAKNVNLIERLIDQNNNDVIGPHLRAISRVPSPTLKEEEEVKFKKSSSPDFDFGGFFNFSNLGPIKRERSGSPECEITGSRTYIDMSTDGDFIDLTQDD